MNKAFKIYSKVQLSRAVCLASRFFPTYNLVISLHHNNNRMFARGAGRSWNAAACGGRIALRN